MADSNHTQGRISFAGFICSWKMPRKVGESTRQRFFSLYEDLQQAVQQHTQHSGESERKWRLFRISAPGRRFLGIARR